MIVKKIISFIFCILLIHTSIIARRRHATMEHFNTRLQEFYRDKKVLVTGGAGFIGSHIVHMLVDMGAHVTVLDNLATGKRENIALYESSIKFIEGDVADKAVCNDAVAQQDIIFHLAAFISVPQSMENPALCWQSNVQGTAQMLEAARTHGIKKFIFSSSASVYGNTEDPCSEETVTNPQSPYAWSKLIGEQCCKMYAALFGVDTICMRYFNVYGERQNPHAAYAAAVAKFTYHMQHDEPITFFGDGMQTRDFVPVETVATINLLLGTLPSEYLNGDIYNVATGKSINLFTLFSMLKEDYPSYNHPIQFAPARAGDVKHAIADCRKLQKLIEDLSKASG